jgi:hypothetical protein
LLNYWARVLLNFYQRLLGHGIVEFYHNCHHIAGLSAGIARPR